MALYKTSEIAAQLGVKPQTLNKQNSRGKIIIIEGYFDTENPINKLFLEKRIIKEPEPQSKTKIPREKALKETKVYSETEEKIKETTKKESPATGILIKSEQLKQQKLEEDIKALQIKNKKELNKLISRDDVGLMVNSYLNRFTMNLQQQLEVLIRDSLNQLQADNVLIKKACSKSIDIINDCQELAIHEIELGFKNISNARK